MFSFFLDFSVLSFKISIFKIKIFRLCSFRLTLKLFSTRLIPLIDSISKFIESLNASSYQIRKDRISLCASKMWRSRFWFNYEFLKQILFYSIFDTFQFHERKKEWIINFEPTRNSSRQCANPCKILQKRFSSFSFIIHSSEKKLTFVLRA